MVCDRHVWPWRQKLTAVLSKMEDKSASKDVPSVVQHALIDKALLAYKSDEVKLLTACCLADVLRLSAPQPPYSTVQLEVHLIVLISSTASIYVCA